MTPIESEYLTPEAKAKIDGDIRAVKVLVELPPAAEGFLRCSLAILFMRGYEHGTKTAFLMSDRVNSDAGSRHEDGREATLEEICAGLREMLAEGKRKLPACDPAQCPDFDFVTGCPGHVREKAEAAR